MNAEALRLTLASQPAHVLPGQAVNYVVTVRNTAASDVPASTLVVTLPSAVTFTSAASDAGQALFDPAARAATLNLSGLAGGQEVVLTVQTTTAASAPAGNAAQASVALLQNGVPCLTTSAGTTVMPAGIPVTGAGPGPRELQLMLGAGFSGALAVLWVARRRARVGGRG